MEFKGSYQGEQPYIFISYAAKDAETVHPIIDAMEQAGYRVWYDEGITPGTQWDERIAARVSACHCVLAVLSQAYFDSENCVDELKYSRDLEKPLVLLSLEEVSLMGSMALRVGRHPKISYDPDEGGEALAAKLAEIDILSPCHIHSAGTGKYEKKDGSILRKRLGLVAMLALVIGALGAVLLGTKDSDVQIPEPTPTEVVYPVVQVLDNELLTATVVDIEKDDTYYTMQMKLQNKSTEKLFFSMENTYLDGAMCDITSWGELEGEETEVIPFRWERTELECYELLSWREDITVIEGSFLYSLQPESFLSAHITYYPLGEERENRLDVMEDIKGIYDVTGSGNLAAGIADLSVKAGKHWRGENGELNLELLLQNKSEFDQTVTVNVEYINGMPAFYENTEFKVEAGRVCCVVLVLSYGGIIAEGEQVVYTGTVKADCGDGNTYMSESFTLFYS